MISVSGKIWTQQKINKNLVEKVKQDYGFGDILSRLIISRNYDLSEIYGIQNSQKLTNIFKDDKDYQKYRAIVRNPKWQKDFLSFPISTRLKIASEAKDASKQSKQQKVFEIMDVNDEAVEAIFNEHQIDLMSHGHTHRPMKHEIVLDGKTYYRYVLGDWTEDSAIIIDWSNDSPQFVDLIN